MVSLIDSLTRMDGCVSNIPAAAPDWCSHIPVIKRFQQLRFSLESWNMVLVPSSPCMGIVAMQTGFVNGLGEFSRQNGRYTVPHIAPNRLFFLFPNDHRRPYLHPGVGPSRPWTSCPPPALHSSAAATGTSSGAAAASMVFIRFYPFHLNFTIPTMQYPRAEEKQNSPISQAKIP